MHLPRRGGYHPPLMLVILRRNHNAPLYPTAQVQAANSRPYGIDLPNLHTTKTNEPNIPHTWNIGFVYSISTFLTPWAIIILITSFLERLVEFAISSTFSSNSILMRTDMILWSSSPRFLIFRGSLFKVFHLVFVFFLYSEYIDFCICEIL